MSDILTHPYVACDCGGDCGDACHHNTGELEETEMGGVELICGQPAAAHDAKQVEAIRRVKKCPACTPGCGQVMHMCPSLSRTYFATSGHSFRRSAATVDFRRLRGRLRFSGTGALRS